MLFMKSSSAFERRVLAAGVLVILSVSNVASFVKESQFNQHVTWEYGPEGLTWKTTFRKPNGQAEYQFMLQSPPSETRRSGFRSQSLRRKERNPKLPWSNDDLPLPLQSVPFS
jgi:hypothetical protein